MRVRSVDGARRYDKRQALISLMFLTKKSSGEIKAHGCADGRKQREHIAKDEATAPTVSTDALFITLVISAHEQHNVASADIPGAFLHADNDERVTMRLDGILAEMMVKLHPLYTAHLSRRRTWKTCSLR